MNLHITFWGVLGVGLMNQAHLTLSEKEPANGPRKWLSFILMFKRSLAWQEYNQLVVMRRQLLSPGG